MYQERFMRQKMKLLMGGILAMAMFQVRMRAEGLVKMRMNGSMWQMKIDSR